MDTEMKKMLLTELTMDRTLQHRDNLNWSHINDLKDLLLEDNNLELTAIIVYLIEGKYFVVDGFHRYNAYLKASRDSIPCLIKNGTYDDALLDGFHTNVAHGLNLSRTEKSNLIRKALALPSNAGLSNRDIAKKLGVSHTYVNNVKRKYHIDNSTSATVVLQNKIDELTEEVTYWRTKYEALISTQECHSSDVIAPVVVPRTQVAPSYVPIAEIASELKTDVNRLYQSLSPDDYVRRMIEGQGNKIFLTTDCVERLRRSKNAN